MNHQTLIGLASTQPRIHCTHQAVYTQSIRSRCNTPTLRFFTYFQATRHKIITSDDDNQSFQSIGFCIRFFSTAASLDDQLTCVFIIDEKHNLLFASRTASDCDCWHRAFRIEDNRLLGLNGISDFTFRSKVLTGLSKRTSVLLKTSESHQEGSQLLLTITPLFDVRHSPNQSNPPCYCLEIQSLDTLYEATVKRMAEKFNLTKPKARP